MKVLKVLFCVSFLVLSSSLARAQSWQWAVEDSGTNVTTGNSGSAVCIDNSGNCFLLSQFGVDGNTIKFGSCGTFTSTSAFNMMLAKYDNSGNCIWAKIAAECTYSGNDQVFGNAMTMDKHGNILVTGMFQDSAVFGTIGLANWVFKNTMFVAKYTNSGNIIWAKSFTSNPSYAEGGGISTDGQCNIYVIGARWDGGGTYSGCAITKSLFIFKLDSNGNCKWVQSSENNTSSNAGEIKTDSVGNSYVDGVLLGNDTLVLGSNTLINHRSKYTPFVAKFDSSGNCSWLKAPYDTNDTYITGLSIDKWDNCYFEVTGANTPVYFGCDTIPFHSGNYTYSLEKLNKNGYCVWAKDYPGQYNFVDPNGNIYTTWRYSGSVSMGSCNIGSGSGIFIAKLDSSGTCQWIESAIGNIYPFSIACDPNGDPYVTGFIYSASTFGSYILPFTSGNQQMFLAKLDGLNGMDELVHQQEQFIIYPNPSVNGFTVQISANLINSTMLIYDETGRRLYQGKLNQSQEEMNIPALAKGIYYIQLIAPDKHTLERSFVQE